MDEDLSNWSDEHKGNYSRCIVGSFVCEEVHNYGFNAGGGLFHVSLMASQPNSFH